MPVAYTTAAEYRDEQSFLRSKQAPAIAVEKTETWGQHKTVDASNALRDATHALFRKWERENGFKRGAGEKLLPAGWRE